MNHLFSLLMKKFFIYSLVIFFLFSLHSFCEVIVRNDNNQPFLGNYPSRSMWEESKILKPGGPCIVKKVQIYFVGTTPQVDTIFIVGDPAEGAIPPTLWVAHFNSLQEPIIFNYTGKAGWYEFPVQNIYLGGLDRIVIQHRLKPTGPWFAYDTDGASTPYSSFLMNPNETNQLGGPGVYYLASGDFLVRIAVEYLYPLDSTSAPPPSPTLTNITREANLLVNGNTLKSSDVSVVDWNNDNFDDIAIGANFFENKGDGKFELINVGVEAGATSWGDINNDGLIDFYALLNGNYVEQSKMVLSRDRIYFNKGNSRFEPINPKEIFEPPYPNPSEDFNLTPKFSNDSIPNPYSCITPLWSDFNSDGLLDLFLANNRVGTTVSGNYVERYFPDQIWIQTNNGKFVNQTAKSKIKDFEPYSGSQSALGYYDCYGANACDYNNDNKIDIFVATYRLAPDLLLQNNGEAIFTNVGNSKGVQGKPTAVPYYFGHGMGSEWGDFNNDGFPDIAVGNLGHPDWRGMYSNPSLIFKNQGPPNFTFEEVGGKMGLKFFEMNAGILWADLDLDGNLDLWHGQIAYNPEGQNNEPKRAARIYFNSGVPDFKLIDKTWELGAVVHGPWSASRIDFDNDGDLDLLVASSHEGVLLFRNDIERKGNWIGFRLSGSPKDKVNMNCFGTKVYLYANNKHYYRELMGNIAGTRCTQNSFLLHFGVGMVDIVDSIIVRYINGLERRYYNIPVNRYFKIPYNNELIPLKIATPALKYPKNYQYKIPQTIQLEWWQVNGAELYEIEISSSQNFSNSEKYSTTDNKITIDNLSSGQQYFWKVRAISSSDTSMYSSAWTFIVGNPLPTKVKLILPENQSQKIGKNPKFIWTSSKYPIYIPEKIYYQLEISKNSNFSTSIFKSDNLSDTTYTLESNVLEPSTTYYWRVKAVNSDGFGEYSDISEFQTNSLPLQAILLNPPNNQENVPLKPNFKWQAIPDVESYLLQLSTSEQFDSLVTEKELQAPTYLLLKPLEPETIYFWRVAGKNNFGPGEWSEVWKFKTQPASSVVEINQEIEIYPNPAKDKLFVKIKNNSHNSYLIQIFNPLGIKYLEKHTNSEQEEIEVRSLPSGIFFLIIKFDSKTFVGKFILHFD